MWTQLFLLLYSCTSFGFMMRAIDDKNYNAILAWICGWILLWIGYTHGCNTGI